MPWTSKIVVGAEPTPILYPARLMVKSASKVIELTNSSKSIELDVACLTVTQERVPEPLVWKSWLAEPSLPGQV